MRLYPEIPAGKWVRPAKRGYRFACCDCGLVHRMDFRTQGDGSIVFRAYRDNLATAKVRTAPPCRVSASETPASTE